MTATDAGGADITQLPALLHGQEQVLYGDQAYWSAAHRAEWSAEGGTYRVNRRGTKKHPLTPHQKRSNRARSRTRARGEHPFLVVKRLWGFMTVRYRAPASRPRSS